MIIVDQIPHVNVNFHGLTMKRDVIKIIVTASHSADVMENLLQAYLVDSHHVLVVLPSTPHNQRPELAPMQQLALKAFGWLLR